MKRFALIGHPVAGSLSPRLFAAAYGGRYAYDLLDYSCFDDAWAAFLDGYDGINVTAPFKQDAFARVDVLSPDARQTGAVNLVVRADGKLMGYNTDVDGVTGAVRASGLPVSRALVVGTGGAARAAAAAARQLGCSVTVSGRSLEKAAALGYEAIPLDQVRSLSPDLVLYTLPGSAPVPPDLPLSSAVVLEAEYKAPALSACRCRAYLSGRQWLLWQAVAGYGLFTGQQPDVENMLKTL